jgi:hypothetical protein
MQESAVVLKITSPPYRQQYEIDGKSQGRKHWFIPTSWGIKTLMWCAAFTGLSNLGFLRRIEKYGWQDPDSFELKGPGGWNNKKRMIYALQKEWDIADSIPDSDIGIYAHLSNESRCHKLVAAKVGIWERQFLEKPEIPKKRKGGRGRSDLRVKGLRIVR